MRHVHLISQLTGKGSGTQVNPGLKWKEEMNSKISSSYATLAVIRRLKTQTLRSSKDTTLKRPLESITF